MNNNYIKDYREKELKFYILAYLLVSLAAIAFYVRQSLGLAEFVPLIVEMIPLDLIAGVASILVFLLNDLWSDEAKTTIVYKSKPSDTIFSDIAEGKITTSEFDIEIAKQQYFRLAKAKKTAQTMEWNRLLKKSRKSERGNVIEAERQQLLTRDLCISSVSLLIINLVVIVVMSVVFGSFINAIKAFGVPALYIAVMFLLTKAAAKNKANRLVILVIKNDVIDNLDENNSKSALIV